MIHMIKQWKTWEIRKAGKQLKYYLKWTSKPSFVTQKVFYTDLVAIHKI